MGVYTAKISVYRGDSKALTLTFTDNDEAVVNITGGTVVLTVKHSKDDADSAALMQKTVTSHQNPTGGISKVSITGDDTKNLAPAVYQYDIQLSLSGGVKKTVAFGEFEVLADITRV